MQPEPETSPPVRNEAIEGTLQPALQVDGKQPLPSKPSSEALSLYLNAQPDNLADEDYDDDNDVDSAYGSVAGSTNTASLASSIYNYKYENGRRYHAYREGEYVLPNDDVEQERLDLQHHVWRLLIGGSLYTAPISEPSRILDLGTGTGIWAIDMADEFPAAEVQGVDLSPIQPNWVPPNCTFHVDDYDGNWTYTAHEAFDFIHGRALSGTSADWPKFYRQIYTHLKPDGWVEMQEYDAWIFSDDDSCDRALWTMEWVRRLDHASQSFNKQINVAQYQKQWMIDAGFVDVKEEVRRVSWTPILPFPLHLLPLLYYRQQTNPATTM